MYAKNGDRRIPPGIVIPENYGGNTFSQTPPPPTPKPPPPPETAPPPSGECRTCDAGAKTANAAPRSADDILRPAAPPPPQQPCDEPQPPISHEPPRPGRGGFMDISIGTEELMLIGVMALVFFGGEKPDNELLICLLLVLLL